MLKLCRAGKPETKGRGQETSWLEGMDVVCEREHLSIFSEMLLWKKLPAGEAARDTHASGDTTHPQGLPVFICHSAISVTLHLPNLTLTRIGSVHSMQRFKHGRFQLNLLFQNTSLVLPSISGLVGDGSLLKVNECGT